MLHVLCLNLILASRFEIRHHGLVVSFWQSVHEDSPLEQAPEVFEKRSPTKHGHPDESELMASRILVRLILGDVP